MNKITGNYTTQANNDFPLDCETLDYIQTNSRMAEIIGNIAGGDSILYGCAVSQEGNYHGEGYVYVHTAEHPEGEVLRYEGGTGEYLYLEKESIGVTANSYNYANAYTQRVLKAGRGTEEWRWQDIINISDGNIKQLMTEVERLKAQMASLQPAPVGSIQIWPSTVIPAGYALCDGSSMSRTDYADLYAVLGTTYGSNDDSSFKLPDMRGLFVAGRGANGYDNVGDKGGANTVQLTANQSGLPAHTHPTQSTLNIGAAGDHNHNNINPYSGADLATTNGTGSGYKLCNISDNSTTDDTQRGKTLKTNTAGSHTHSIAGAVAVTANSASSAKEAHENRPPYIVMCYIIKVR